MAGETPNNGLSQIQMQALTQHLERLMKQQSDVHERLIKWSRHNKKIMKIEGDIGGGEERIRDNKDNGDLMG